MPSGYAGEVCHGSGDRRGTDTIHIPEQAQVERDIVEDGAEDSGSLEDEPRQISASGGTDLYEAGTVMRLKSLLYAVIMMVLILMILSTAIGIQP